MAAPVLRVRARWRLPLAALTGVLAATGQAPVSLPWATLLALALAFGLFLDTPRTGKAAWLGWAFGWGYFAATLFWIVEPFLIDIPRHGWMAPFALIFTAGGFAGFWAGAFALAAWGARGRLARALAWTGALTLAELTRSYLLTGFPWALVGHVWVDWAPMQLAAWVGPVGLSLLTLLIPALAVALWPRRLALAGVLAVAAALYGAGAWRAAQPLPDAEGPVLRLVQPNAAQHLKWDPDWHQVFMDRLMAFTAAEGAEGRPRLVIWPETALPYLLHNAEEALAQTAEAAAGVPVVLGIQRVEGWQAYNSLIVLNDQGRVADLYDKYHLVPFGEYLPAGGLLSKIGLSALTAKNGFGYTPGPGPQLLDLGPFGRALPLICYEAIFPHDVNAAPERPDWLLQITNDGWFGNLSGPYQHLAQARLRAVEQGLPLVRAANTGVSAVIDAHGEVLHSLPLNEAGWLDAPLPAKLPRTLYARTGDVPVALLLAALALGLGLTALRRRGIDGAGAAG